MKRCPKCNQKVIVVPFLEHFYPSPTRVVFDFYCQNCDFRLGTQQQQRPWLLPDKIKEPYMTADYDEYYFADANVKRWLKRHGLRTMQKLDSNQETKEHGNNLKNKMAYSQLLISKHPLAKAKQIKKPNY